MDTKNCSISPRLGAENRPVACGDKPFPAYVRKVASLIKRCYNVRVVFSENASTISELDFVKCYKDQTNFLCDVMAHGRLAMERPVRLTLFTSGTRKYLLRSANRAHKRSRGREQRVIFSLLQAKRSFPFLPTELRNDGFEKHRKLLSSRVEPPFSSYNIVEDILDSYFPIGWGKNITGCLYNSIKDAACLEGKTCRQALSRLVEPTIIRSCGAILAKRRFEDQMDRLQVARANSELPVLKCIAIPDAGKYRIITKDSVNSKCLKPVQEALLKQIQKFPEFRYTGKPFEFERMTLRKGQFLLSIDYSSATDSVDGSFVQELVEKIIDRSGSFWLRCLRDVASKEVGMGRRLENPTECFVQRRGTLMGSLLSFPLLCLWNASIIRRSGIKKYFICGDDALCIATRDQAARWSNLSKEIGCEPTPGKSFLTKRFGTFCSKYQTQTSPIPFANTGHFFGEADGSNYNKIPDSIRHLYKRYCKWNKIEWRSLVGPGEIGGLGGHGRPSEREEYALLMAQKTLSHSGRNYLNGKLRDPPPCPVFWSAFTTAKPAEIHNTPRQVPTGKASYHRYKWYNGFRRRGGVRHPPAPSTPSSYRHR